MSANHISSTSHVFIIGSKGVPARYGGFETFVDRLVSMRTRQDIQYHVACLLPRNRFNHLQKESDYNGARCFDIKEVPIGPAKAILYDLTALRSAIKYARSGGIPRPVFLILACRIGPFIRHYAKNVRKLGGVLMVNPDGHEFLRRKWSLPARRYWKYSESLMVKHASLVVCDSRRIEDYVVREYRRYQPSTTYIPYGGDLTRSTLTLDDERLAEWFRRHGLRPGHYYLVVGRLVPENNFDVVIREFMQTSTEKHLVIITGLDNEHLIRRLSRRTQFALDARVKFVGTVYDAELLKEIREDAFAYLHGHEVGGTNPSLLEALASTDVSLLLEVGFNREVADTGALYWSKAPGDLARLIQMLEEMSVGDRLLLGARARARIAESYSWDAVVQRYESLFSENERDGRSFEDGVVHRCDA